jgi:hypothetical protein
MATALNESAWSTTAATNDGADSTIGNLTNSSSPTAVDDWVRGLMASRARARLDQGGALVAGGTSTALTVTTNQSLSASHIANGLRLCVRTASAATGAATITIDGLTAVDIKTNGLAAIASGDWASGAILDLVYSSTASAFITENIGPSSGVSITSLTEETAPDHAADFIPMYDTSASANRKVLPRYFAPSVRASFFAHRNNSNQSVASASETQIVFTTEGYDVGSYFASNTWTPPAGTVALTFSVGAGNLSDYIVIRIKKNSTVIAEQIAAIITAIGSQAYATVSVHAQSNGSDTFTAYVVSGGDTSYTVDGTIQRTFFCGSMI